MTLKQQQKLLAKMIKLAAIGHENQFDKGGNAYILHPLRIMYKLRHESVYAQIVAVGHDLIEDTPLSIEDLEKDGFPEEVLTPLSLLTHTSDQSYDEYIIAIAQNEIATIVKLSDLKDNSDLTRLKGITEKDFKRMTKYQMCYHFLTGKTTIQSFQHNMKELLSQ